MDAPAPFPLTTPARHRLLTVQAARGAAALMVVLYHAGHGLILPQYKGFVPLGGLFNFGHAGVDFFFVLSGFIICFVHLSDAGRPDRLWRYVRRRLTRIYPIYWIVTFGAVVFLIATHGLYDLPAFPHLVSSLLLVPDWDEPIVGVAWTLRHEMVFYVLFAATILDLRLGLAVLAAWAGVLLAGLVWPWPATPWLVVVSSYNLHFFLGMAAALLTLRARVPMPRLVTAIGATLFVGTGLAEDLGVFAFGAFVGQILFGIGAAILLAGLAAAERDGTLRAGRGAELFGGMSYSLYLIHIFLIGPTAHVLELAGLMPLIPGWLLLTLLTAESVAVALALHLLVEQPVLRVLNGLGRRPAASAAV